MADRQLLPRQLLTAPQVAQQLGRTASWFYRNRAVLEDQHRFPRPVDGCGMRWDPRAIERWLDARLPGSAPAEPANDLHAAQARLMARLAGGGHGR